LCNYLLQIESTGSHIFTENKVTDIIDARCNHEVHTRMLIFLNVTAILFRVKQMKQNTVTKYATDYHPNIWH